MIFDRQVFYTGQVCSVKVICDNSQSSTAVKSFKIKLKRKIFARGLLKTGKEQNVKISKYLVVNKAEGCKERTSCDKTLSIQIPSKDPDLATGEQMA